MFPTAPFPFNSEPPPPQPLVVENVNNISFDGENGECNPVFNTTPEFPLRSVEDPSADPDKWRVRWDEILYRGLEISNVEYNEIRIVFGASGEDPGDNEIWYLNDPRDISDDLGRELEAFTMAL